MGAKLFRLRGLTIQARPSVSRWSPWKLISASLWPGKLWSSREVVLLGVRNYYQLKSKVNLAPLVVEGTGNLVD